MDDTLGTVAALYRYPVKSMLGEELDTTEIAAGGVRGDRAWALVDHETGKVASDKNPRLWRDLLKARATWDGDGVRVTLPDGTAATGDRSLSDWLGRTVTLTGVPPEGATLDRAVPEEVLDAGVTATVAVEPVVLGQGAPPGAFVDFAPVHLISAATLRATGAEAVRYRPNLVLETGGEAYEENGWAGRTLTVGSAVLRVIIPTPRCAVPTLEHGDLPRLPQTLRVPAKENLVEAVPGMGRSACAGAYAEVIRPGRITVGDRAALG
ncbi:MOSC domain-containing protein [Actinomadura hibisca]|uniref:MOSC domain-containing protein n=1 Tax=Actinomadura hibisca TaxID=68565 RepID=UPI0008354B8C|nr:MOSC N-terminal beta barrel domain-containing protein [Actinomadura hibisca]